MILNEVIDIAIPEGNVIKIENTEGVLWEKLAQVDCLCFTAEEANSTIKLTKVGQPNGVTIEISRNGITWVAYNINDTITLPSIGSKIYWGGNNEKFSYDIQNYYYFYMTGKIAASNSIESLCGNISKPLTSYCYYRMFFDCTSLTQAPELPATTLAYSCYNSLFFDCTSLAQVSELPATTLADYCYNCMFDGCTSLVQAPALPATTLADYCYNSMFSHCTSLTQAPELSATTLAYACCSGMFYNCTSLVQAPELPATTLAYSCYSGMFWDCTFLTQAPELPATTLVERCYRGMFQGCTSLTQAPELPATTLAERCYDSMFYGCTSLTQAPELPATTLAERCYDQIFRNCTSLIQIKINYIGLFNYTYFASWVNNISAMGDFYYNGTDTTRSASAIPFGWTVHTF